MTQCISNIATHTQSFRGLAQQKAYPDWMRPVFPALNLIRSIFGLQKFVEYSHPSLGSRNFLVLESDAHKINFAIFKQTFLVELRKRPRVLTEAQMVVKKKMDVQKFRRNMVRDERCAKSQLTGYLAHRGTGACIAPKTLARLRFQENC